MILLYIFIALIVSLTLSILLYHKNPFHPFSFKQTVLLFILRAASFFILLLLLFPIQSTKTETIVEKPQIVLLIDNSRSMVLTEDSTFIRTQLLKKIEEIKNELEQKAQVSVYAFDSSVYLNAPLTFSGTQTNISAALDNIYQRYQGRNLTAIVLITDGIANTGADIISTAEKSPVPIISVGVGDTLQYPDISIQNLRYNKQVVAGSTFPIEIVVRSKLLNNRKFTMILKSENKEIERRELMIKGNDYTETILLFTKAIKPGLMKLNIEILPVGDEKNTQNNYASAVIHVIDRKTKGLIIYDSPHPDIQAIAAAFDETPLYSIQAVNIQQINKFKLNDFDFFILYQVPGKRSQQSNLKEIIQMGKPQFWIIGTSSNIQQLPSFLPDIKIQIQKPQTYQEFTPWYNQQFSAFSLSQSLQSLIEQFPPLMFPFASITINESYRTLLYQKIGQVRSQQPILTFRLSTQPPVAIFFGEGFFKWKLFEFQRNQNHAVSNEIIQQTIGALTQQNNKNKLRIYHKDVYYHNEDVEMTAEFYDLLNQLTTIPDITLSVSQNNQTRTYEFLKMNKNYFLNLGKLETGQYQWKATALFQNVTYNASGTFFVEPFQLEEAELTAHHGVLKEISTKTNGSYFHKNNIDNLSNYIKQNFKFISTSFQYQKTDFLISRLMLLVILTFVLCIEWFLRKFFGSI